MRLFKYRHPKIIIKTVPGSDPVCCTGAQIDNMAANIRTAASIFGRCATCMQNMLNSICEFTCSPEQSRFMNVSVETVEDWSSGTLVERDAVLAAHVNMDERYINATYESCRHVVHPASGRIAMALACGAHDASTCNARHWYQFMGDPELNRDFVPFLIEYNYDETDAERMLQPNTRPCHEAYAGAYGCSCVDCPQTCPTALPPAVLDGVGFQVAGLNGVSFVLSIVFGVLGILIVSLATLLPACWRLVWRVPDFFAGVPAVTGGLAAFFGWWGRSCARHPVLTLAVCSWLTAGLAFGVRHLIIVTDPVELWAAPESQTRLEKDYFDERFGPFFRTSQVFVKARNAERFNASIGPTNRTFGPAFEREFLLEVMRMQKRIERLGVDEEEGLENVCFALVPEMKGDEESGGGAQKKCVVQSVLGYFGDRLSDLEEEGDFYLETLDMCISSPMSPECLAPFGGPVEPGIVFGGQPKVRQGEN